MPTSSRISLLSDSFVDSTDVNLNHIDMEKGEVMIAEKKEKDSEILQSPLEKPKRSPWFRRILILLGLLSSLLIIFVCIDVFVIVPHMSPSLSTLSLSFPTDRPTVSISSKVGFQKSLMVSSASLNSLFCTISLGRDTPREDSLQSLLTESDGKYVSEVFQLNFLSDQSRVILPSSFNSYRDIDVAVEILVTQMEFLRGITRDAMEIHFNKTTLQKQQIVGEEMEEDNSPISPMDFTRLDCNIAVTLQLWPGIPLPTYHHSASHDVPVNSEDMEMDVGVDSDDFGEFVSPNGNINIIKWMRHFGSFTQQMETSDEENFNYDFTLPIPIESHRRVAQENDKPKSSFDDLVSDFFFRDLKSVEIDGPSLSFLFSNPMLATSSFIPFLNLMDTHPTMNINLFQLSFQAPRISLDVVHLAKKDVEKTHPYGVTVMSITAPISFTSAIPLSSHVVCEDGMAMDRDEYHQISPMNSLTMWSLEYCKMTKTPLKDVSGMVERIDNNNPNAKVERSLISQFIGPTHSIAISKTLPSSPPIPYEVSASPLPSVLPSVLGDPYHFFSPQDCLSIYINVPSFQFATLCLSMVNITADTFYVMEIAQLDLSLGTLLNGRFQQLLLNSMATGTSLWSTQLNGFAYQGKPIPYGYVGGYNTLFNATGAVWVDMNGQQISAELHVVKTVGNINPNGGNYIDSQYLAMWNNTMATGEFTVQFMGNTTSDSLNNILSYAVGQISGNYGAKIPQFSVSFAEGTTTTIGNDPASSRVFGNFSIAVPQYSFDFSSGPIINFQQNTSSLIYYYGKPLSQANFSTLVSTDNSIASIQLVESPTINIQSPSDLRISSIYNSTWSYNSNNNNILLISLMGETDWQGSPLTSLISQFRLDKSNELFNFTLTESSQSLSYSLMNPQSSRIFWNYTMGYGYNSLAGYGGIIYKGSVLTNGYLEGSYMGGQNGGNGGNVYDISVSLAENPNSPVIGTSLSLLKDPFTNAIYVSNGPSSFPPSSSRISSSYDILLYGDNGWDTTSFNVTGSTSFQQSILSTIMGEFSFSSSYQTINISIIEGAQTLQNLDNTNCRFLSNSTVSLGYSNSNTVQFGNQSIIPCCNGGGGSGGGTITVSSFLISNITIAALSFAEYQQSRIYNGFGILNTWIGDPGQYPLLINFTLAENPNADFPVTNDPEVFIVNYGTTHMYIVDENTLLSEDKARVYFSYNFSVSAESDSFLYTTASANGTTVMSGIPLSSFMFLGTYQRNSALLNLSLVEGDVYMDSLRVSMNSPPSTPNEALLASCNSALCLLRIYSNIVGSGGVSNSAFDIGMYGFAVSRMSVLFNTYGEIAIVYGNNGNNIPYSLNITIAENNNAPITLGTVVIANPGSPNMLAIVADPVAFSPSNCRLSSSYYMTCIVNNNDGNTGNLNGNTFVTTNGFTQFGRGQTTSYLSSNVTLSLTNQSVAIRIVESPTPSPVLSATPRVDISYEGAIAYQSYTSSTFYLSMAAKGYSIISYSTVTDGYAQFLLYNVWQNPLDGTIITLIVAENPAALAVSQGNPADSVDLVNFNSYLLGVSTNNPQLTEESSRFFLNYSLYTQIDTSSVSSSLSFLNGYGIISVGDFVSTVVVNVTVPLAQSVCNIYLLEGTMGLSAALEYNQQFINGMGMSNPAPNNIYGNGMANTQLAVSSIVSFPYSFNQSITISPAVPTALTVSLSNTFLTSTILSLNTLVLNMQTSSDNTAPQMVSLSVGLKETPNSMLLSTYQSLPLSSPSLRIGALYNGGGSAHSISNIPLSLGGNVWYNGILQSTSSANLTLNISNTIPDVDGFSFNENGVNISLSVYESGMSNDPQSGNPFSPNGRIGLQYILDFLSQYTYSSAAFVNISLYLPTAAVISNGNVYTQSFTNVSFAMLNAIPQSNSPGVVNGLGAINVVFIENPVQSITIGGSPSSYRMNSFYSSQWQYTSPAISPMIITATPLSGQTWRKGAILTNVNSAVGFTVPLNTNSPFSLLGSFALLEGQTTSVLTLPTSPFIPSPNTQNGQTRVDIFYSLNVMGLNGHTNFLPAFNGILSGHIMTVQSLMSAMIFNVTTPTTQIGSNLIQLVESNNFRDLTFPNAQNPTGRVNILLQIVQNLQSYGSTQLLSLYGYFIFQNSLISSYNLYYYTRAPTSINGWINIGIDERGSGIIPAPWTNGSPIFPTVNSRVGALVNAMWMGTADPQYYGLLDTLNAEGNTVFASSLMGFYSNMDARVIWDYFTYSVSATVKESSWDSTPLLSTTPWTSPSLRFGFNLDGSAIVNSDLNSLTITSVQGVNTQWFDSNSTLNLGGQLINPSTNNPLRFVNFNAAVHENPLGVPINGQTDRFDGGWEGIQYLRDSSTSGSLVGSFLLSGAPYSLQQISNALNLSAMGLRESVSFSFTEFPSVSIANPNSSYPSYSNYARTNIGSSLAYNFNDLLSSSIFLNSSVLVSYAQQWSLGSIISWNFHQLGFGVTTGLWWLFPWSGPSANIYFNFPNIFCWISSSNCVYSGPFESGSPIWISPPPPSFPKGGGQGKGKQDDSSPNNGDNGDIMGLSKTTFIIILILIIVVVVGVVVYVMKRTRKGCFAEKSTDRGEEGFSRHLHESLLTSPQLN